MLCSTRRESKRHMPLADAVLPAYGRIVDFQGIGWSQKLGRWRD
jgi:hypothetical protein